MAVVFVTVAALPLIWSVIALLDAARRPGWVWALAGKSQALWMALILMGILSLVGGLIIATIYMRRIRPILIDAENGILRN